MNEGCSGLKLILLSITFLLSFHLSAQSFNNEKNLAEIDSLKQELNAKPEAEKAEIFHNISTRYVGISYDSTKHYINLALSYSEKHGDIKTLAHATKNIGLTYSARRNYIEGINYQKKAIELAKQIKDYELQVLCYNNIGYMCNSSFQIETGLSSLFEGLKLCEQHELKDKSPKGLILGNIAACYTTMGKHQEALKYLEIVTEYAIGLNNTDLQTRFCDELSLSLLANGKIEEAKSTCTNCVTLSKASGYSTAELNAYTSMAKIFLEEGSYEKAEDFLFKSEELANKLGFRYVFPELQLLRSKSLAKLNKPYESIELAKLAYQNPGMLRSKQAADITEHLSQLYLNVEDYNNAYKFQSLHLESTQAIQDFKLKHLAEELEAKYQNKNQQKQIELLQQEKQLSKDKTTSYILGLGLLSILMLFTLSLFFNKRKVANKLQILNDELNKTQHELKSKNDDLEKYVESNIQLEQFAHVASHDLKAPITTIKSFSELLDSKASKKLDLKEKQYLQFIKASANQTFDLVNDLLDYSKINSQKLNLKVINIEELIREVCTLLLHGSQNDCVSVSYDLKIKQLIADELKLKRVFQNIISNSIKFSDNQRLNEIHISSFENYGSWMFSISDTGIGIKSTNTDIFKPYKQLHTKEEFKGTGMGLAICEKVITQHNGEISYTSDFNQGTTFQFSISKQISAQLKSQLSYARYN